MTTLFDDDIIYDIINNNNLSDLELPYIININVNDYKKIIQKYIGNLQKLPYNLKIQKSNILLDNYTDIIKKLFKTYLKTTLKSQYSENDIYKKLYVQFIHKEHKK